MWRGVKLELLGHFRISDPVKQTVLHYTPNLCYALVRIGRVSGFKLPYISCIAAGNKKMKEWDGWSK
jgi:hypothetical protein